MEPLKEESKKAPQSHPEEKRPKRFRLVKLEERIAPSGGRTNGHGPACDPTHSFSCGRCFFIF